MTDEGEEVRRAREARGMSLQRLADASGVGISTIKRIEAGATENSRKLRQVQHFLRIGPYASDVAPQPYAPAHRPDLTAMTNSELTALLALVTAEMTHRLTQMPEAPRRERPSYDIDRLATAHDVGPIAKEQRPSA